MRTRSQDTPTVVVITGCTASGKARLAHELAQALGAEIVSVDSMKVYREMDIGTAKPSPARRQGVPYHLIDVADPGEPFSAARFVELAEAAVAEIHRRGRPIVACGGTVLYLKALTEGLFPSPGADPQIRRRLRQALEERGAEALHAELRRADPAAADRIHRNDAKRIVRALEVHELTGRPISELQRQFGSLRTDWNMLFLGVGHEREHLNRRINARVKRMIEEGFVEEVRRLARRQPPVAEPARQALGYAELFRWLEEGGDLPEAVEQIKIHTRRFAKSQRTWFRRLTHIRWIDIPPGCEPAELAPAFRAAIDEWRAGLGREG